MEQDKISLMNYLPLSELTGDSDDQVDSCIGAPVRFLYFNTSESCKIQQQQQQAYPKVQIQLPHPDLEDSLEDDEKQKGRVRQPDKWRQNQRKKNKNHGLEYVRANGEVSAKKEMGPPCKCKNRCYLRIGNEACQKVFTNFWKLGDHSLQNAYIAGCVRIFLPKQYSKSKSEVQVPSRRFYTRCFYVNVNGVDTEICKQAFLNLHSISNGRLDRLLKKKQEAGNTGIDARGRHSNKVNKVPLDKIREVRRSIEGFRKRAGFTGKRRTKTVEILPGPLNIRTMYRVYRDEVLAKGMDPVCEFRYRKIFHNDFHIDFARPALSSQSAPPPPPPPKPLPPIHPAPPPHMPAKPDTSSAVDFTLEEKPVYTTLESKDTTTYVTISQELYSGYTMQPQSWIFPAQN